MTSDRGGGGAIERVRERREEKRREERGKKDRRGKRHNNEVDAEKAGGPGGWGTVEFSDTLNSISLKESEAPLPRLGIQSALCSVMT